jgi:hypothetical protein
MVSDGATITLSRDMWARAAATISFHRVSTETMEFPWDFRGISMRISLERKTWFPEFSKSKTRSIPWHACMHSTEQHNVVQIAGKTHWFRVDSVEQLSNVTLMVSAKDGSN